MFKRHQLSDCARVAVNKAMHYESTPGMHSVRQN